MSSLKFTLIVTACAALLLVPGQASALELEKLNGDLVRLNDGKLEQVSNADLDSKKYVAFYYSAHWCPPCRAFTPELSKFYDKMKKQYGDDFELIFVSSDKTEDAMKGYMEWAKMNFPALKYHGAGQTMVSPMGAAGIPYLVVVDKDGKEVLGKGSEDWVHPGSILEKFEDLLKG